MSMLLRCLRLPLLALLLIFEPVARVALSALAFACALCAVFFKFTAGVADFPFIGMVCVSIGCLLMLKAYYGLLRLVL